MIALRLSDIAHATGGRLDAAAPDVVVDGPVVVDSRQCRPGSLFVAVAGARADGHDHTADAIRRGAVACLLQRPTGAPSVVVADTVRALGAVAAAVLERRPEVRVTGVTGSSGKTSTKDLLREVLGADGPTVAPVGSFNNEVGLPLTVAEVDDTTRHAALEYSARGLGHIAYLTSIARPSVGVVLNVGAAHLGEFGSRALIARAKGELIEALPADGVAVLNGDDELVAAMATRTTARVLTVGRSPDADVRISDLTLDTAARPRFRLDTPTGAAEVTLRLHGAHQADNAAAAAAVGLARGIDLATVVTALQATEAVSPHRMQLAERADGLLVVDDAYNANPESMRAALDALARLGRDRPGRTWAVLGEMRELGPDARSLHADVGRHAAAVGVDRLVVVAGTASSAYATGARSVAGWPGEVVEVADPAAATALLRESVAGSDTVVVKASNALALWTVAAGLLERATAPATGAHR